MLSTKKLNITLKPVNLTWDDYRQKIQIWAASSQLPDLFAIDAISTPNYEKWITEGIVHELPNNFSAYPSLKEIMDQPDIQAFRYPLADPNGKFYCIPRPTYPNADMWANDLTVLMRKDWMENVGITKQPENMDEFITLMKAFVENDPDKNGKKDTVGLTAYSASWLTALMLSYEPGVATGANYWVRDEKSGGWLPGFMTENCLEGLKELKRLYDSGGLDKDFATIKGTEGQDKFVTGRAGAYAHTGYPTTLSALNNKFVKTFPDFKFDEAVTYLKPWSAADGNKYRLVAPTPWSESYINAKADDVKVDRILRLFDYLFSEEGFNLIRLGIEGTDWKKDGDKIVITREKNESGSYDPLNKKYPITGLGSLSSWAQDFSYKNPAVPEGILKMGNEELDWRIKNCKPINTDLRAGFIDYASKDKHVEQFADDMVKAILSDDVEKTWNQIIKEHRANGYDEVIKDFNAKAAELGIK